jgi:hypothetical protein
LFNSPRRDWQFWPGGNGRAPGSPPGAPCAAQPANTAAVMAATVNLAFARIGSEGAITLSIP